MKNNKISIFTKAIINILLIGIQLAIPILIMLKVNENLIYLEWALNILSIALILLIVYKNEKTSFKLSWIVIIAIFPINGLLLYFLIGRVFVSKKIINLVNEVESTMPFEQNEVVIEKIKDIHTKKQIDLIYNLAKFPVYNNTTTKYFKNGEDMFASMLEDLRSAKKFIFMEHYIVAEGKMYRQVLDVLIEKSKEGVEIIFLYDYMGSMLVMPKDMSSTMTKNNIKCIPFNNKIGSIYNFINFRDHRKITIVDGNIGYTGGINLGDEYINKKVVHGKWKDMAIRLEGEGVLSLTVMFLKTCHLSTNEKKDINLYKPTTSLKYAKGFVVPYGDGPTNFLNPAENIYIKTITSATKYLYITTPYLIIDYSTIDALVLAARTGVDVRIITPFIPDKKIVQYETRSFYGELLSSGIKIYEYTPGFMHGKTMVSDDKVAIVGSINMDYRSLTWNYECAVFMYDTESVLHIRNDFLSTVDESQEVDIAKYTKYNLIQQLRNAILRIISPLM